MRSALVLRAPAVIKCIESVHSGLSPKSFVDQFQLKGRPGLFRQLLTSSPVPDRVCWPALSRWSHVDGRGQETLAGLRRTENQNLSVPVEVSHPGRGYNVEHETGWERIELPFHLFLDAFIEGKIPWNQSPGSPESKPVGYLAQFDLLSCSPSLAMDAPGLPHTKAGPKLGREQWRSNVWIGPSNTFTPLHRDPYENMFAQVVGSKRVLLFAPHLGDSLYLNQHGSQINTSTIVTEEQLLDPSRDHVLLHRALAAEGTVKAIVGPGDVLYIPQGWFHCVKSLSTSVSVNFWYR